MKSVVSIDKRRCQCRICATHPIGRPHKRFSFFEIRRLCVLETLTLILYFFWGPSDSLDVSKNLAFTNSHDLAVKALVTMPSSSFRRFFPQKRVQSGKEVALDLLYMYTVALHYKNIVPYYSIVIWRHRAFYRFVVRAKARWIFLMVRFTNRHNERLSRSPLHTRVYEYVTDDIDGVTAVRHSTSLPISFYGSYRFRCTNNVCERTMDSGLSQYNSWSQRRTARRPKCLLAGVVPIEETAVWA